MPDSRRPLRRITFPRPLTRGIVHLTVIGLVALTAALGLSSARTDVGTPAVARGGNGSTLSFDLVGPARAAGESGAPLRSTTFELQPQPGGGDPIIARRLAVPAPTPPPTPLPTPVAPPPPAPDPPAPAPLVAAQPVVVGSGVLGWPVAGGEITQYYSAWHLALDVAAPYGTTVIAADAGVVIWAGWRTNGGGYVVAVDHGNGIVTVYNHLSSIWVSVGQAVARGQGIAAVGCTGICTGPHVHFEVEVGGVPVNPLRYL